MEEFKVAEEVAVKEVKDFIEYHLDEAIDEVQVAKDYRDVVKAVMRGLLDTSNPDSPKLILKQPIVDDKGNEAVSEVTFLTRMPPSVVASLARGIDMQKDALTLANKMTAWFTQQDAVAMLNKFGKVDFKVIQAVVGLFQ